MKKTVLIADDEPFIRNILTQKLKHDYRIITAGDGMEALIMVKKEKPDLIILDVDMPKKNGHEVAWELKKGNDITYRNIPIIMLTHRGKGGEVEEGFSTGADIYIPKPFKLARLYDKIKALLKKET
ncbi:MAG: response regulator [Elusimicrobiota bacterium]